jgi:folate-binding protein YgfZ
MTKQSSLIDFHKGHGAVLAERDGWLLPAHFGDAAAEYHSVRSTVGLIDLSHRGLLQFTGPDRLTFLQGMLSNDLRVLKPFDGQYATVLTQQGKVIADVRVLCSENSFYLDFWEPLEEKLLAHLNRYLVADEVEIAERSGNFRMLSLQGPKSEDLLRTLCSRSELPAALLQHGTANLADTPIYILRASHTGEAGFDLIVPFAQLAKVAWQLTDVGGQFGARWVGEEPLNILRVEAGIPRYGIDFSEDNLLLEVDIEHAVSFNKGCYLGQEVIERIRSRGHVNKKLCGLTLAGQRTAAAGDSILAGDKEVGKITSSVDSPALKRPIALGYVQKDFWSPGTTLAIRSEESLITATVTALPFVGTGHFSS